MFESWDSGMSRSFNSLQFRRVKMSKIQTTDGIVQGIWKFRDSVPSDELLAFAKELLASEPERYQSMSIRRCSSDQVGICFIWTNEGRAPGQYLPVEVFYEKCKDLFYRQFGTGFVGWDLCDSVCILK